MRKTRSDCRVETFEKKNGLPPGTVKNSKINDKQSVVINKAKLKQFLTE